MSASGVEWNRIENWELRVEWVVYNFLLVGFRGWLFPDYQEWGYVRRVIRKSEINAGPYWFTKRRRIEFKFTHTMKRRWIKSTKIELN